jgi:cystathionine beta-lyase/cystathionine gamma-synthase
VDKHETTLATQAVHAGDTPRPVNEPASLPIYQSAGWAFRDLDEVDAVYERRVPGAIYGTDGLPNTLALEALLASLEGAQSVVVTSGGMSALLATFLGVLREGDRILASRDLYGNSVRLINHLARFGVSAEFLDAADLDAVRRALAMPARLVLVETISNPRMRVADVRALADLAHERGALLLVDNTLATPWHCRPLALGADFVMESATKFLSGHHDVVIGAVGGARELVEPIRTLAVRSSIVPGAFDSWLAARSARSVTLRVEREATNAARVAGWLAPHPKIRVVHYPGLESHPDHAVARRVLENGFGPMLSFEIDGGAAAVNRLLGKLELIKLVLSFGGVGTTLSHPAKSSHRALSPEERAALGIHDGFLRLSVGIEAVEDIEADLKRGLDSL